MLCEGGVGGMVFAVLDVDFDKGVRKPDRNDQIPPGLMST
jgi:hypothetical protein